MDPKHRFLADPALGKLAKWLRILGMDAQYISTGTMEGAIAACEPDRILLTRSKRFAKHAITGRMGFINSNDPMEQLKEVIDVVACNGATSGLSPIASGATYPYHRWKKRL